MDTGRTTIKDVARRAGVSESTVSRVLNRSKLQIPVSEDTLHRILEAASELGYRPHPSARALRSKSTDLLGLIVREVDDPFFSQLIDIISNVAKEEGYHLVLGYARRDPQEAIALSAMLDFRYCDGLFLIGDLKESPGDQSFLASLHKQSPLVTLCRGIHQLATGDPGVGVDNAKGVRLALDYLTGLGHRRIAFIDAGRLGDLWERLRAYRDDMSERFGEVVSEYIQPADNSYAGGYLATKMLLSLPSRPSAILAADDTMAIGAMRAAAEMGLHVPRDVSIVGFDDIKVAAYLRPALTTVRQPIEAIGRQAVLLLLDIIRQKAIPESPSHILIDPELIIRESCAPPQSDPA